MSAWFSVTGLSLKIDKTNIVKISSHHLQNDLFQITYQNKIMKEATNITLYDYVQGNLLRLLSLNNDI
jgi:hypothetical protein